MFAVYVTVLLCWLSVSHSAHGPCEDLLQPVDHPDFAHLEGTWPLVVGSLGNATFMDILEKRDSISMVFANTSDSSAIPYTLAFNINDTCHYKNTIIKMEGSHFFIKSHGIAGTLLKTSCDDCILIDFDDATKAHRRLLLFSKKREVEQKEMDKFTAQAACLNMTLPVRMDPTKMLCPEQVPIEPTPKAEEKTDA